jgi:hypothetical protein
MLLALCALTVSLWWASKPVLLHTHLLTKADYRSCGAYNEEGTGVTILNPLRSRVAERAADSFLLAASNGRCSPETSEGLCKAVTKRPLPGTDWNLVYRRNLGSDVDVFYRLRRTSQECVIAEVKLKQTGGSWKIFGYGVSY